MCCVRYTLHQRYSRLCVCNLMHCTSVEYNKNHFYLWAGRRGMQMCRHAGVTDSACINQSISHAITCDADASTSHKQIHHILYIVCIYWIYWLVSMGLAWLTKPSKECFVYRFTSYSPSAIKEWTIFSFQTLFTTNLAAPLPYLTEYTVTPKSTAHNHLLSYLALSPSLSISLTSRSS